MPSSHPSIVDALRSGEQIVAAELRPPRAELAAGESMDAWIDTYHAVRGLTRQGTYVFLTDNAVGADEEDNLRHLVTNLGSDVPRERVVPFLTCKHPLEYCLGYADRARQHGFPALVVLGGDRTVGVPRCVEHAWELREQLQGRDREIALGGWANPNADAARQIDYLLDAHFAADFYLTQIVSHHTIDRVARFTAEAARRGLEMPGVFGVFYYRSANARTLQTLAQFIPVPADALTREFRAGAAPEDVCARTLRAAFDAGVKHVYVSNLPLGRAQATLEAILSRVGVTA